MKTFGKMLLGTFIICLISFTASAQGPGWEKLGTRFVDFAVDHDEVPVTGQEGTFTALKIQVFGAHLNMHRLVIHYRNNTSQEVELRNNFEPGTESRVIDLVGDERIITSISLFYDTNNNAPKKAKVEVWGKH